MRITGITIALLILIAIAVSGCLSNSEAPVDLSAPRENSDAGVQITVTYLPDITDATAFDIKVTAHKDYDDDFKNNSYLRDSSGKTYQPLSYEGEGGHHASGTLRFPKIESKSFELVIKDVAGVNERIFKW
ncbi:MAG: hypothetical protein ABOK23_05975 [Candidatus Methanoperedens sp.]|nr:hypothetical protein [Candidatus Methanoperedens sp.]MCZ7396546.1 hypothetical protein [Candidatus Methanoperedens sp.]